MLLLPALYLQVHADAELSTYQRVAYEPLLAAAVVVDKIISNLSNAPSMAGALRHFFEGGFGSGRVAAAELLSNICLPLFAAFLPSHSSLLAQTLTRLLRSGPVEWEEPLFLLVAYALQHPEAPGFVDNFHLVIDRCVDGDSDANVYCLSSAMRAAVASGDQLTSQLMATGKPFSEVSNIKFYESEARELEQARDVVPAIAHVLATLQ